MRKLQPRIQQPNDFFDCPYMVSDPHLHGWRNVESLMDSRKIVKHKVRGDYSW